MDEHLLEINHVSKKFCRRLKRSLFYGIKDVARQTVGLPITMQLRPEEF